MTGEFEKRNKKTKTGRGISIVNEIDKRFPDGYTNAAHFNNISGSEAFHTALLSALSFVSFDMSLVCFFDLSSLLHRYESRTTVRRTLMTWGFQAQDIHLIGFSGEEVAAMDGNDHQLIIATIGPLTFVVFRGTELLNMADWLEDARFALVPLDEMAGIAGEVHDGFWRGVASKKVRSAGNRCNAEIVLDILAKHQLTNAGRLVITGHSLGAALATTFAAYLLRHGRGDAIQCIYTFGQPRIGDRELVGALADKLGDRMFRYCNADDVVPRMPPSVGERFPISFARRLVPSGYLEGPGRLFYIDDLGTITPLLHTPELTCGRVIIRTLLNPFAIFASIENRWRWSAVIAQALLPIFFFAHFPALYLHALESRKRSPPGFFQNLWETTARRFLV